jgi:hypothetical protein
MMFEKKKRSHPIVIRLLPDESEKVRRIAECYKVSISSVLRELILKKVDLSDLLKLAEEQNNIIQN